MNEIKDTAHFDQRLFSNFKLNVFFMKIILEGWMSSISEGEDWMKMGHKAEG